MDNTYLLSYTPTTSTPVTTTNPTTNPSPTPTGKPLNYIQTKYHQYTTEINSTIKKNISSIFLL
jgi:hypothetical protein